VLEKNTGGFSANESSREGILCPLAPQVTFEGDLPGKYSLKILHYDDKVVDVVLILGDIASVHIIANVASTLLPEGVPSRGIVVIAFEFFG
jgi:hypothetical protein